MFYDLWLTSFSGNLRSLSQQVNDNQSTEMRIPNISVVLAVIQEKVNNPSPDDPYEPQIAAVRRFFSSFFNIPTEHRDLTTAHEDR